MTIFQNPIDPPEIVKGWINNKAHHGKGKEIPIFYPGNGSQVSVLVEDAEEDVDKAVASARRTFDKTDWSKYHTKFRPV